MAWQPTKPEATDLLSQSQADIQGNFTALNNVYGGINNYIMLPEQAVAPVTAANNMAIYTKAVSGVSAMFIRPEGAGTEIDITTYGVNPALPNSVDGWCRLPCGILMRWGYSTATKNVDSPIVFAFGTFPGFGSQVFSIQTTQVSTGTGVNGKRSSITVHTATIAGFTAFWTTDSTFATTMYYYLAMGI